VAGHKRARDRTSRGAHLPTEGELPGIPRPGPDHAREWVIGVRRGVVRNRCVTAVIRVLDRVGAGLAHGWIKRAFRGHEVVWHRLAGRERGLAKGKAAYRTLWCRMTTDVSREPPSRK
jgi:hypothetical protein